MSRTNRSSKPSFVMGLAARAGGLRRHLADAIYRGQLGPERELELRAFSPRPR